MIRNSKTFDRCTYNTDFCFMPPSVYIKNQKNPSIFGAPVPFYVMKEIEHNMAILKALKELGLSNSNTIRALLNYCQAQLVTLEVISEKFFTKVITLLSDLLDEKDNLERNSEYILTYLNNKLFQSDNFSSIPHKKFSSFLEKCKSLLSTAAYRRITDQMFLEQYNHILIHVVESPKK